MQSENIQLPVPDQVAMQRHVEHLFLDCMHGIVELAWTDPDDGAPRHANLFALDRLDELVEKAAVLNGERRNVYVGAALRKETAPPFGRSNGVDFLAATALWADLDDPGGTVRASNRYRELGVPPTLVVVTGIKPHQRAQCWWRLDEPDDDAAHVRTMLGALQMAFASDASVVDPARIMRLGGSIAWPTKDGRVIERTEVINFDGSRARMYGMARLEAAFPLKEKERGDTPGLDIGGEFGEGVDEEALIAAARTPGTRHVSKLRLVAHWVARGYSDASILLLGEALGHDGEQTRRKFADMVASAREKWNRPDTEHGVSGVADAWPEPLDIIGAPELVGWPALTGECLPGPLHRYVTAEAQRLNVDPCPLAAHVLAACAASISDGLRIRPKHHDVWTQQARLWVCVVKDVGARGTEMIRAAFWPVKDRDADLFKTWQCRHAEWKIRQSRKAAEKRRGTEDDDPEPKCHRLITNDASVEAMSEILKDGDGTGKLTLLCDELVAFLGGFGRYTDHSSAARAIMLEAYDGGPQRVDRIRRGHIFVPNWSVVVAGNIQPRRLAGMAENLIDDGLFQRFLTIHTHPALLGVDDDKPIAPSIGRDYRELHEALATLKPVLGAEGKPLPCFVDADGHAERRRFMRLVERLQADPTLPTIIRETAPKWSGLLARLSLIFHAVDLAEQRRNGAEIADPDLCRVAGATVTMAATFMRRIALPNLFRLGFETLPEAGSPATHARWIAGNVLAHGLDSITASKIGRVYRELRGKPALTAEAMAILVDSGWARRGPGRHDSVCWEINPAVHARFAAAAEAERTRREGVRTLMRQKVEDL